MDINALLSNPGVYESAFQNSRQAEMQNQMRQAQAQQLIQEVMQKQQMMPLELEKAGAYTDFMRAQADQMRRGKEDTNAERKAKAEALKSLQQQRSARGALETALTMPEGRNEFLQELLNSGKLPPEIAQRLRPTSNVDLFTNDNLNKIIESLREVDPEASKTLRENLKQTAAQQRVETQGQTARDVAKIRSDILRDVQELKGQNQKPLTESQVMGMLLQKVASGNITPEELKALDVEQIMRAASATVKPGIGITPTIDASGKPKIGITPSQQKPSDVLKPKLTPEQEKMLKEL